MLLTFYKAPINSLFSLISKLSILTIISGVILSCSPNKSTTSIKFMVSELSSRLEIQKSSISGHNRIYSFLNSNGEQIYLTGLSECHAGLKGSESSLSRQLFVGFENLRILQTQKMRIAPFPLRNIASASIDMEPLKLVSFSSKKGNCILDIVFWSAMDKSTPISDEKIIRWADTATPKYLDVLTYALSLVAESIGTEKSGD